MPARGDHDLRPDPATGRLVLAGPCGRTAELHPVWLRERATDPHLLDHQTLQRLFEPNELPPDLRVVGAEIVADGAVARVRFSDGVTADLSLPDLAAALGWEPDPDRLPAPEPWRADALEVRRHAWGDLERPDAMLRCLGDFRRLGFALIGGTPTEPGSLEGIASRFGHLRETNFGRLFDVVSKPVYDDLAYTGVALAAHTDNPYRAPVPGIQLLHCLHNEVPGGESTLVDGLAAVAALEAEDPEGAAALASIPVRFAYRSETAILIDEAPIVERKVDGTLAGIRFSPRLDEVPALGPGRLDVFYRARRRLFRLLADPALELRFKLEPGGLMVLDNRRVLHGRTAFEGASGRRHLQGCYIDHDGPSSLYRVLSRQRRAA